MGRLRRSPHQWLLAATFSVLTVLPVVFTVQLGLLVAVGVLLDTFGVRALLVSSLTLDIGPRIWWPGRLSRPPAAPATARETLRAGHR